MSPSASLSPSASASPSAAAGGSASLSPSASPSPAPEGVSSAVLVSKPLTYAVATVGRGRKKLIKKNLEYAIIVSFIDLDPDTLGAQVVIVDDRIAIRLNGRIYTKI